VLYSHVISALAALVAAAPAQAETSRLRLCATTVQTINASAAKTLAQGSPGMLVQVAKHSEVLFTGTYGYANLEHSVPVRRETVFNLASITKQFTAAAILLLAEEGKLKLDDKLSRYVPELRHSERVTLNQLLVHTSGIPDYSEDPSGAKTQSVARTPAEMLAWIATLTPTLAFEPGTKWAYSNSNYALLGLVAERISGEPLSTFFERRLFTPAGLTATAFDSPADIVPHRAQPYRRSKTAPAGFIHADWISPTIPGPAGGLRSTGDDLIRWTDALFGGRILKAESLEKMIRAGLLNDGRTTKFGMPKDWQKGLNSDYGMGVFIKSTAAGRRIGHGGNVDGFVTWLAYYPAAGVTIVHMINSESADIDIGGIEAAVFSETKEPCIEAVDDHRSH
jgi:CubicO group peptidase (beta-lactamase class C family)